MSPFIANLILVQLVWFVVVLDAAVGPGWAGPVTVALSLEVHRRWLTPGCQILAVAAAAAALGLMADTILAQTGAITYPRWSYPLSPPFMICLWVNLATALPCSLGWLRQRYVLAALLGAVGGPLAYASGARLGAVSLPAGLFPVAIEWALCMPLLLFAHAAIESHCQSNTVNPERSS